MLERRFLWILSLTKSSTQCLAVFYKSKGTLSLRMIEKSPSHLRGHCTCMPHCFHLTKNSHWSCFQDAYHFFSCSTYKNSYTTNTFHDLLSSSQVFKCNWCLRYFMCMCSLLFVYLSLPILSFPYVFHHVPMLIPSWHHLWSPLNPPSIPTATPIVIVCKFLVDNQLMNIRSCKRSAKEWKTLTTFTKFICYKIFTWRTQEDDDLLGHINNVKALVKRFACLEELVKNEDVVMNLIKSLPPSYEYLIINLESIPMKELTMEYVTTHWCTKCWGAKRMNP